MDDQRTHSADSDAEQLRALGYVSHFDRTMSKWENFSLGFTYLSPVVGVYTLFATAFVAGGPPMWWTYIAGRPGTADGVPDVRRDRLAVSRSPADSIPGRGVSSASAGPGWRAGYTPGRCAAPWPGVATGIAPFLAQLFGIESTPIATTADRAGAHRHDHRAEFERHAPARAGCDVRLHLRADRRHRGRRLSIAVCAPSALARARRHVVRDMTGSYLPAFLASSLAAMFCYYGFEACGDVAEETPDASRMIPKAMRMTIYIGGAAASWVCLAFVLSIPDIGAVIRRQGYRPHRHPAQGGHGRSRVSRRHRGRAGLVHLLPVEPAGRRQPADVRLCPGSDDLRQQVPEPHVAGPPRAGQCADRDGRDTGA